MSYEGCRVSKDIPPNLILHDNMSALLRELPIKVHMLNRNDPSSQSARVSQSQTQTRGISDAPNPTIIQEVALGSLLASPPFHHRQIALQ